MSTEEKNVVQQEQELKEILQVRRDKLSALQQEGNDPFLKAKFDKTHDAHQIFDGFEQFEGKPVAVAGRIMSKRIMEKQVLLICRM